MLITILALISYANANDSNESHVGLPNVFFTSNISPSGLMAVFDALGVEPTGNVAVKVHSGEPGNQNFLRPEFMAELVQRVNGTFIETNVAYRSRRQNTASHYIVAEEHGWTVVAPFVVLDGEDQVSFPVTGGRHLTELYVGSRFDEFDYHIVMSHFKGHALGGFGGALKNVAIGYASAAGKAQIHTHGQSSTNAWRQSNQTYFLESMAEAAKAIIDRTEGRIVYINVMNALSIDCDCDGNAGPPVMADIGILASLDPVALDQACIDLVYAAHDGHELIERIESRNGLRTVEFAEELGIGSRRYQLINIDR
jgi:hypothetical protein